MEKAIKNNTLSGILFMLLAMFVYSVANVFIKSVVPSYGIMEIVFFRSLLALMPAAYMVRQDGGISTLRTPNMPWHILCGITGVIGMYCLFRSFQLLPLADATCLGYGSILFVTALSGPFLGERIDALRWLAVILGFVGVIIMANPTGNIFNEGIVYILVFSMVDAFVMLSARKLSRTDKPGTIVFYYSLFATLASGVCLGFIWKTPDLWDLGRFMVIGLGGGTAQICVTQAYRLAPAGSVAPMIYSSVLWSVLFGYLFWGDFPSLNMWAGCAVVIASGLYIIWRENSLARGKNDQTANDTLPPATKPQGKKPATKSV